MSYFKSGESEARYKAAKKRASATLHRKYVDKYNSNPKRCIWCGMLIPYEKRDNDFCNKTCSATLNNMCRGRLSRTCINCGKVLNNSRKDLTVAKFCSTSCSATYTKNKNKTDWLNGKKRLHIRVIRQYIIDEQGGCCAKCGLSMWNELPIALEIEHKDGNSENNNRVNLECICPNCHAQTATYKNKNKGNGRGYRRIRYREGKSY